MKSHKLFSIVLLLLFGNAHSQATLPEEPAERARQLTAWMKNHLQLTDEQVIKVEPVNLKCAEKNVELQSSKLSKRKREQKLTENEQYRDTEMKKILSPDQYSVYETRKKEMVAMLREKLRDK